MIKYDGPQATIARSVPMEDSQLTCPWDRLVAESPDATVFSTPFFQRALFAVFGPNDPRVILVEKAGQTIGLMPVAPLTLQRGPVTLREVGFHRCVHTLRNTLLVSQNIAATKALLLELMRTMPCDSILFQNVPIASGTIEHLQAAATALGLRTDAPQSGRILLHADLGNNFDDFLALQSGQMRRQLRKRLRNLNAEGGLRIEALTGSGIRRAMRDWRHIVESSWQGLGDDAVGNTEQDWDFHGRLVANGVLYVMYLNDRPIACLRHLEHNNVAYLHTMNFVQAHRDLAPGLVLFEHALRDIVARGNHRMDFNGNTDFYKRFATGETPHQSLRIYRQSIRGQVARHLRSVLKTGI